MRNIVCTDDEPKSIWAAQSIGTLESLWELPKSEVWMIVFEIDLKEVLKSFGIRPI